MLPAQLTVANVWLRGATHYDLRIFGFCVGLNPAALPLLPIP